MRATITLWGKQWRVDLSAGHDISVAVGAAHQAKAWYVPDPEIKPVEGDGFVGAVALGGSVNFRNITFNPHGHGTHTECLGHITKEVFSVNTYFSDFHVPAQLVSITPTQKANDQVITRGQLELLNIVKGVKAIVIRTLPLREPQKAIDFSNSNPAYLHHEATAYLVEKGIEHLLIDMPSVDKEEDGGALRSHHTFWNTKGKPRKNCTITELIYVPKPILDGLYLLNLQVAPIENDAAPSRPILFPLTPFT